MPSIWRAMTAGVRRLFRREAADREFTDEVNHYLEESAAEHQRAGLSPEAAARAARAEFGSRTAVHDQVRGSGWEATLESVWRDTAYGLRALRRTPGFTIVAVSVLALSIAVNTAVFSIINAVLLRPLPVHAPSELAFVYKSDMLGGTCCSMEEMRSYRADRDVFVDVASVGGGGVLFGHGADMEVVASESVSANYFDVLGVVPRMGRAFDPDVDERPTATPVIVISDRLWRTRFGASPEVLGAVVRLGHPQRADSGWRYAIVGVLGPEFTGVTSPWQPIDLWVPDAQRWRETGFSALGFSRTVGTLVVRRQPDITIDQVQALVTARHAAFEASSSNRGFSVRDRSLRVSDSRRVTLPLDEAGTIAPGRLAATLMGVAGLVLLIGVANLVGVTVARGVVRRPEIAVRLTLGAGRGRLARQLVTEGLLLAALGGLGGLALSRWFVTGFLAGVPQGWGLRALEVPLDVRVLLFAVGVIVLAGVTVGLAPVRAASRTDLLSALRGVSEAAPTRVRSRFRYWIVIPQVCVCTALLLVGGVAAKALLKVALIDPGYQTDAIGMVRFNLARISPLTGLNSEERRVAIRQEEARQALTMQRIIEIAERSPSLHAVGLTSATPAGGEAVSFVLREGYAQGSIHYSAAHAQVTDGYLDAIRLPLRAGRTFDSRDTFESARVILIDESLATRLWPGSSPIGQYLGLHQAGSTQTPDWREVIGVVGAVRHPLSEGEPRAFLYLPLTQSKGASRPLALVLVARAQAADTDVTKVLRSIVAEADPDTPVTSSRTLNESIDAIRYPRRLATSLVAAAGIVGVLLAGLGLYGVVSYSVAQRMRELGIRAALGAERADLMTLVLREGALVGLVGLAFGFGLAWAGIRLVSNRVFAMPGLDVATALTVPVILAGVVLLACYLPARRAARVDPMVVLRWL